MKRNVTYNAKKETVERKWYVVDATDKVLGRMATAVARILRGKDKATFTPHVDTGDYVIIVNAGKVRVTGKKAEQKTYFRHSGYPGGDKTFSFDVLIKTNPCRIIEEAVWGMLPKGRLGSQMIKKLKIYAGEDFPQKAQAPLKLEL
ncbi:MAG: 50S ribosomal protein L13 [Candidatus Saganbacteria bacterium]|nr:50S ribosomal protein L13 [Candidatus Saganbacteria bacterium]